MASTRTAAAVARPGATVISGLTRAFGDEPRGLTIVGWHRIGRSGGDGLTTTPDDFRRHLDVLEDWGAEILPLSTAVAQLADGTLPRRAVSLTFDDGYASVVEQAWPELARRGYPATLYAVSGYLDPGLTFPWDRHSDDPETVRLMDEHALLEAADAGLEIGSHTVSHRWLPHLNWREARVELSASRASLEDLLQRPVRSFAYPLGGWNQELRDQVDQAGYEVAITVDRGRNQVGHDPLSLRRCFAFDGAGDFRLQLDGGFTFLRPAETFKRRRGPAL
jgi:peptidoglycan/xylan/chitin deacetylase (PgdA/CDA1 family)